MLFRSCQCGRPLQFVYQQCRMLVSFTNAPTLTTKLASRPAGELVGARLIAHVGSLVNLAKQPASTIQILGAEKALFRWGRGVHGVGKISRFFWVQGLRASTCACGTALLPTSHGPQTNFCHHHQPYPTAHRPTLPSGR